MAYRQINEIRDLGKALVAKNSEIEELGYKVQGLQEELRAKDRLPDDHHVITERLLKKIRFLDADNIRLWDALAILAARFKIIFGRHDGVCSDRDFEALSKAHDALAGEDTTS